MRVSQAIYCVEDYSRYLLVTIDGRKFSSDTKYTILEMGYATYIGMNDRSDIGQWILENGENIPPDPEDARIELKSGSGTLITSDPILFTLAYEAWWNGNGGKPLPENTPLPIPLLSEALEVMKNRTILNDFNQKYRGTIPNNYIRPY